MLLIVGCPLIASACCMNLCGTWGVLFRLSLLLTSVPCFTIWYCLMKPHESKKTGWSTRLTLKISNTLVISNSHTRVSTGTRLAVLLQRSSYRTHALCPKLCQTMAARSDVRSFGVTSVGVQGPDTTFWTVDQFFDFVQTVRALIVSIRALLSALTGFNSSPVMSSTYGDLVPCACTSHTGLS